MSLFGKSDRTAAERERSRREREERRAAQSQQGADGDAEPQIGPAAQDPPSATSDPRDADGRGAAGERGTADEHGIADEHLAAAGSDDRIADGAATAPLPVGAVAAPILAVVGAEAAMAHDAAGAGGYGPTGMSNFSPDATPTIRRGPGAQDAAPSAVPRAAGGPGEGVSGAGDPTTASGQGGPPDDNGDADSAGVHPVDGDLYDGAEPLPPPWVAGGVAAGADADAAWQGHPGGDDPFGVEPMPPRPGLVGNPFAGELPEGLRMRPGAPRQQRVRTVPPPTSGERAARWIKRLLAVAAVGLCAFAVWFAIKLFQPFHGAAQGTGRVTVVIPQGAGSREIGDLLAARGVVDSGFFFYVRAKIDGKSDDLHSGRYVLAHDMSYSAAIAALEVPPPPPPTVRVLIPEGTPRSTIATLARADGLRGSYLAASRRSALLDPRNYGAPARTRTLEGFLFPATYDLFRGANVSTLVADQLQAFTQHFTAADVRAARRLHVTPYGLLTIASMIEREAELPQDRAQVSEVIYRRLRMGMPLGIDATLRYALNDWSKPLTDSQLALRSPYNTRLHTGLPPTPIGNPGAASIDAAAHPAGTHWLYYVAGADGCGELRFANTYADFLRLSAAYQAALASNGGRVPTCKQAPAKPAQRRSARRAQARPGRSQQKH